MRRQFVLRLRSAADVRRRLRMHIVSGLFDDRTATATGRSSSCIFDNDRRAFCGVLQLVARDKISAYLTDHSPPPSATSPVHTIICCDANLAAFLLATLSCICWTDLWNTSVSIAQQTCTTNPPRWWFSAVIFYANHVNYSEAKASVTGASNKLGDWLIDWVRAVSWLSDCVRDFSPWASLTMEAAKETKFAQAQR